jgi:UDP-N-acetylglucosamine--dolichyl-phosphate N-acetylglucosaminephosphotransferase
LFFILNFLYSLPQLFHLVPCPRHRLPKYSKETDTVNTSVAVFRKEGFLSQSQYEV